MSAALGIIGESEFQWLSYFLENRCIADVLFNTLR